MATHTGKDPRFRWSLMYQNVCSVGPYHGIWFTRILGLDLITRHRTPSRIPRPYKYTAISPSIYILACWELGSHLVLDTAGMSLLYIINNMSYIIDSAANDVIGNRHNACVYPSTIVICLQATKHTGRNGYV